MLPFEAIADPALMPGYFILKGSGRLEEGKTVMWQFPEWEKEFPVRAGKIEKDRYISFYWENDGLQLLVEFTLNRGENESTVVTVTEKGMKNNEAGIKWFAGTSAGWANFLACL